MAVSQTTAAISSHNDQRHGPEGEGDVEVAARPGRRGDREIATQTGLGHGYITRITAGGD